MTEQEEYRILLEEKELRLKKEIYKTDPLLWFEERFNGDRKFFEWSKHSGYEKHTWDGDKDPLAQAWETIGKAYKNVRKGELPENRYIGLEAGTGTSKTFWLARLVVWFLDCFENSLVITSAPGEKQLKLGLWAELGMLSHTVKKIRPEAKFYKLRMAMDETPVDDTDLDAMSTSESWHAIGFVTGTAANEQSSSRAKGVHRKYMLIILEECTGIPTPIMTAFKNTSTGLTNFIVAVGNPDNEFDPLHQFCIQPDVKSFRVSALDYPNLVLNREIYEGGATWASINSRKLEYGEDNPLFKAQVRGISPTQSANSLIRLEWIEQCINIEIEKTGYNAVGVDVANSVSGDKAALAWGEDNTLLELQEFYCENATHLAYNLIMDDIELASNGYKNYNTNKLTHYNISSECVGIDAVGVGVATVNAFSDKGYDTVSLQGGYWIEAVPKEIIRQADGKEVEKPKYTFPSLRSQMYYAFREALRLKLVSIQVKDPIILLQLKKELTIPKFEATGKSITVESKETIKKRLGGKSPNIADAAVYWWWVSRGYRISKTTDYINFFGG